MNDWFKYFWTSPVDAPPELGFGLFTTSHLVMLTVLAVIIATIVWIYTKANTDRRHLIRLAIGIFVLFLELVLRQGAFIVLGIYTPAILPLHACAIATFCVAIDAFKPNSWCREFIYAVGTWGPLCALLFPDWANQPIINIFTWQSFVVHAFLFAYALMLLVSKEFRPSARNLWMVLIIMAVFVGASLIVNNAMGTNFWFLATAAPGSPLEPIQKIAGGFYIPLLSIILSVLWAVMYLPWHLPRRGVETHPSIDVQ
ncbi:MAG: TIGR02206 family membrane protein [Propionibacteriaceae bacterium]|jgi:hypothetical integral membrane protein (TIGR02206 family)|nr:TIGR02206 family membrane protein [Propionibacteriaceae bacterium]